MSRRKRHSEEQSPASTAGVKSELPLGLRLTDTEPRVSVVEEFAGEGVKMPDTSIKRVANDLAAVDPFTPEGMDVAVSQALDPQPPAPLLAASAISQVVDPTPSVPVAAPIVPAALPPVTDAPATATAIVPVVDQVTETVKIATAPLGDDVPLITVPVVADAPPAIMPVESPPTPAEPVAVQSEPPAVEPPPPAPVPFPTMPHLPPQPTPPPNASITGKIATWTGRLVSPLAMTIADLSIHDIAHSLANQCRYAGHCRAYSVAEHSVLVSLAAERAAKKLGLPPVIVSQIARRGLAHNFAEAYLPDMVRPLKQLPEAVFYVKAGDAVQELISEWLGLRYPQYQYIVDEADTNIIGIEARTLMPNRHPEWDKRLPPDLVGVKIATDPVPTSDDAERMLKMRFMELWPDWNQRPVISP